MSLLAVIDYSLVLIFFICITGLLFWGTRLQRQQVEPSVISPAQRESLVAYLLLVGLFLLLIVLTALTQKTGKQSNTFLSTHP